jgi:hypothetical protein
VGIGFADLRFHQTTEKQIFILMTFWKYFLPVIFVCVMKGLPLSGQDIHEPDPPVITNDTLINSGQQSYLPILSESQEKQKEPNFYKLVLFYYHKSNFLFRIILFLNLFFLSSAFFLTGSIFLNRMRKDYIARKKKKCENRYRDFIIEWIYEVNLQQVPSSVLRELEDPILRDTFTTELLSIHISLTGESAYRLVDLFHKAGLKPFTIRKIHSMFWPVKAKGIKELAQMNITSENHLFVKYLNSRNDILGLEAQLAWIRLNPDDPLKFYDDPKIQLTDWGQVNSLIAFKKIGKIPDFGKWIESKTRIVVIFALKMTGILKEFQNELLVQQRLYDSDPEIRREAVIALGRLELSSSNPNLRQIYPRENLSNKAEILRALSITSDSENFSLFKEVLLDETDISTRILAAKGIVGLDQNCRNKLDLIFAEAEPTLKKIIMHAKDNRI